MTEMPRPSTDMSPTAALARRWPRAGSEAGLTLIEVLVSALMVVAIGALAATAFIGSTDASGYIRLRADAQTLAQQDQNRLRALTIDQLSNLNQTQAPVVLDGASFTVKESASYVSDATGTPSCTNPSADYLRTVSTVSWSNMGSHPPVTASSILTPTVGSIDSTKGMLAVSVINGSGSPQSGMNVAISGPSGGSTTTTANQTTDTGGCVLFGDLPTGTYSVSVTPALGTFVDAQTGAVVTPTAPDTASPSVTAGSTASAPTQFQLDAAASAAFTTKVLFPSGLTPNSSAGATVPAVVLFNTNMSAPQYRVCAAADAAGCPIVGHPDSSFASPSTSGATSLFPFTSPYSAYAGVCSSDEPALPQNGGTDASLTVTTTPVASAQLTLPAMVVRLHSGTTITSASEEALPVGSHLVITDTGCNLRYAGNSSLLPLLTTVTRGGATDYGVLQNPGMPYGSYTACYDNGTKHYAATVTNKSPGEVVDLFAGAGALTTGVC